MQLALSAPLSGVPSVDVVMVTCVHAGQPTTGAGHCARLTSGSEARTEIMRSDVTKAMRAIALRHVAMPDDCI